MKKTLDQLFQVFLYECEFVKKVRPETLRGYSHTFQLFLKLIPECDLNTLSPGTVTTFFRILQERKRLVGKVIIKNGIKKSTVATYWGKLKEIFSGTQFQIPFPIRNYLVCNLIFLNCRVATN